MVQLMPLHPQTPSSLLIEQQGLSVAGRDSSVVGYVIERPTNGRAQFPPAPRLRAQHRRLRRLLSSARSVVAVITCV